MNILILGSGGREHALAYSISLSPHCNKLYTAPGNAGTAKLGMNLKVQPDDFESVARACILYDINLLVVGPEAPLVNGIRENLLAREELSKLAIFGPGAAGAILEGSKDYSKLFMQRHEIPTANYKTFTESNYEEGEAYILAQSLPVVLKADGLAAGKGVIICHNYADAVKEYDNLLLHKAFGDASAKVVIEQFLTGIEMSVFVLFDGENYLILPEAKDYKRVGEGCTGLNTGGMGAVSPLSFCDKSFKKHIEEKIVKPTINGLISENIDYKGVIFIGLIVEDGAAKVIEYNCRFGDPETEVILPRIDSDVVELLWATATGKLAEVTLKVSDKACAGVVAVSGGYPGNYENGAEIKGMDTVGWDDTRVYHAGTRAMDSITVSNGGRVLVAVSLADSITSALKMSYETLDAIAYDDMYYRKDIGYEFV